MRAQHACNRPSVIQRGRLAEVVPDVRVVEQPNLGLVGFAHIAFVAPLVDKIDQQLLAVALHLLFEVRLEGGTLESTNARKVRTLDYYNTARQYRSEHRFWVGFGLPRTESAVQRAWA